MSILNDISENLQQGKAKVVKELVQQAIDDGIPARQILEEGLLSGMNVVGEKFKANEVFVPEVLVAARAMNMGTTLLKPLLAESGVKATGSVKIMVGGAPVTDTFCQQIGADKYTHDAATAADTAVAMLV